MPNLDAANRERIVEIVQKVVKQSDELIGGVLLLHEFIPVLAVTTVEAYLRDVLVYAASIDRTLMARSELASSYPEIWKAASLETLLDELRERAAKSNLRRLRSESTSPSRNKRWFSASNSSRLRRCSTAGRGRSGRKPQRTPAWRTPARHL
jgi:hypothetical protein